MTFEAPAARRICEARWLGRVEYSRGLALQQEASTRLQTGEGTEELLLLEHPHVFTLGRGADPTHILASPEHLDSRSIEVYETGRGGDVTYHGPGQLVG